MKTWKKIEETKKRTSDITGLKKRNEEKVQKVSDHQYYVLIWVCYRKSSTFNWKTSKSDTCHRITIWYQNRDMRKKEKFQMHSCSKRRRKPSSPKWLNSKTNKEKDKICSELSKRIRWRTKLVSNLRDSLKWK